MDSVEEIKMRLPIEQLVAQYCQLTKKGRSFVCLCPFHNDTRPSFLVSPDKGIAYCFACRSGGDIFSFYQKIENIDFGQALKELAEKAGVTLEQRATPQGPKKDEKQRMRMCLEAAQEYFVSALKGSKSAQEYLEKRGVTPSEQEQYGLGLAPDSFSATYEHLLKVGFSRGEILAAGLAVQRDLNDQHIYDRFRHRLMFPIHDPQGALCGFGGRTLGNDDAKYVNTSESPLFQKSKLLFGLHHARDAIRQKEAVLLVEGYFDVLACRRSGAAHAVATCGTALTAEHVKMLRRYADRAILCLDSDRAGRDAMERSFILLASAGMHVETIVLKDKDPADAALSNPEEFIKIVSAPVAYLDAVLTELSSGDMNDARARRDALQRLQPLLGALTSAVERQHYIDKASAILQTTASALRSDVAMSVVPPSSPAPASATQTSGELFSSTEIALGLFFFYPYLQDLLAELIEPEEPFAAALFNAIKKAEPGARIEPSALDLGAEERERCGILALYCDHHGFADWSESLAARELKKHCRRANRDILHRKQEEITRKLLDASRNGRIAEQAQLQLQYQQVLKLMHMAS